MSSKIKGLHARKISFLPKKRAEDMRLPIKGRILEQREEDIRFPIKKCEEGMRLPMKNANQYVR